MPEPVTRDEVVARLHRLYDDEPNEEIRANDIEHWLAQMNPDLNMASPIELIRAGRGDEVLELVEDLLEWAKVFEEDATS